MTSDVETSIKATGAVASVTLYGQTLVRGDVLRFHKLKNNYPWYSYRGQLFRDGVAVEEWDGRMKPYSPVRPIYVGLDGRRYKYHEEGDEAFFSGCRPWNDPLWVYPGEYVFDPPPELLP